MSSSNNQDWQRKLEELEAQINQDTSSNSQEQTTTVHPQVEIDYPQSIKSWLNLAKDWFNSLAPIGQVAVGVVVIMVGFSVLNIFLKVISSLVSIVILGGLLYLGYKYIFANSSQN